MARDSDISQRMPKANQQDGPIYLSAVHMTDDHFQEESM
jgi:hypothetical protein